MNTPAPQSHEAPVKLNDGRKVSLHLGKLNVLGCGHEYKSTDEAVFETLATLSGLREENEQLREGRLTVGQIVAAHRAAADASKVRAYEIEIPQLREENAALKARVAELEAKVIELANVWNA